MNSIQATSEQRLPPVHLDLRSRRVYDRTPVAAKPMEVPRDRKPRPERGWCEDLFSVVLLCVLTVSVLAATAMFARTVLNEIARYSSYDLLLMMGGGI